MRRVISGTGKVLITLGILILLFVGYQLWGTGVYTARAQNQLESQFEKSLSQAAAGGTSPAPTSASTTPGVGSTARGTDDPTIATAPATSTTTTTTTTTTLPAPSAPAGNAIAHIVIPKVGIDWFVVEGVDLSDLRDGPGHYPLTPFPGQKGNAGIAGHRTTYGAPFGELGELEAGDSIQITTVQGTFNYTVYEKLVVSPDAFEVLDPDPTRAATLTLTTCNPKYSAAQRLIIKAELQLPPAAEPLPSSVNPTAEIDSEAIAGDGLSGNTGSKTPTIVSLLIMLLIGALWWLMFHRHPRWTTWLVGALPFAVALAIFYFYLERVLPSNY